MDKDIPKDSQVGDGHEAPDVIENGIITIESFNGFIQETVTVPVIDGKHITHIEGMRIVDARDIHNVNGKLNGVVVAQQPKPKREKVKVRSVPDEQPETGAILVIQGGFVPEYNAAETRPYIMLNGNIIYTIGDEEIFGGHHIRNIGGRLNGVIEIKDGAQAVHTHDAGIIILRYRTIPVLDGHLIKEIDGQPIFNCLAAYNLNGQLYGIVEILETGNTARTMATKVYSVVAGKLVPYIDEPTGPRLLPDTYEPPFNGEKRKDPIQILSGNFADAARLAYLPSQLDALLYEFPEFEPFIDRRKKEYAHFVAEAKTGVLQTKLIQDWLRQVKSALRHQGEKMRLVLEQEETGLNYLSILSKMFQLRALIKSSAVDPMKISKDLQSLEELEDEVIALGSPKSSGIDYNHWIRSLGEMALGYGYQEVRLEFRD